MKYLKRLLLPLLLVFLLLFGLTGCGAEIASGTTDEPQDVIGIDAAEDGDESDDTQDVDQPDEDTSPEDLTDIDESQASDQDLLDPDGTYTSKDEVALFIYQYGELPQNFITKKEAQKLGWEGGSLEDYAPGKCIGGSTFGNYEGLLPEKEGRTYKECDIDTLGAKKRGAKRIVYSNDGLIYYTEDHYESFELLYGTP